MDGTKNVQVDTIHGILRYKRKGRDEKVQWAPPSALRDIDLILTDEASQYGNRERVRFMQSVAEQLPLPYLVGVAGVQAAARPIWRALPADAAFLASRRP